MATRATGLVAPRSIAVTAVGLALASGAALASSLQACGGDSATNSGFGSGSGSGTTSLGGDGGVGSLGGGSGSGSGLGTVSPLDCPASAKLVYVTGQGSKLYSFYPPTFQFTLIGTLSCLGGLSPSHMTVDRSGTAWVVATDQTGVTPGKLFKASTVDATCNSAPNWTPQPNDFADFALTFLGTTSAVDTTLYMLGSTGGPLDPTSQAVLGTFNTSTGVINTLGNPQVQNPGGDMTTNGDGTLYFLMDQQVIKLYEIDPSSAAVKKTLSPAASGGGDQALAFWGGSFYAFENNIVYQFDPVALTTKQLGNAPLQVTGAGQSTCVPTVPPTSK
jgi:hypothetical protein